MPELLDQLVTIARFDTSGDAHVAKCTLEGAGIYCVLRDEEIVSMVWWYSLLIGGIKLQVRQSDVAAANEILATEPSESLVGEAMEQEQRPRCPKCGAMDVIHERIWRRFAMGSLFVLGIPIPIRRDGWKCRKCCHEWHL
jgi:hypothetical protein